MAALRRVQPEQVQEAVTWRTARLVPLPARSQRGPRCWQASLPFPGARSDRQPGVIPLLPAAWCDLRPGQPESSGIGPGAAGTGSLWEWRSSCTWGVFSVGTQCRVQASDGLRLPPACSSGVVQRLIDCGGGGFPLHGSRASAIEHSPVSELGGTDSGERDRLRPRRAGKANLPMSIPVRTGTPGWKGLPRANSPVAFGLLEENLVRVQF